MRVTRSKLLSDFWQSHPDVKSSLQIWYAEADAANWKTPTDIKQRYGSADFLPDNRVVLNIKGNHYRLVLKIHYPIGVVEIRYIGTHADYDRINARTI